MPSTLMISGAVKLASSKPGRKIIGVLLSIIGMLLLVVICVITGMISIFSTSGKIDSNFDAKNTPIYIELRSIYDVYAQEQQKEIESLAKHYTETNMDYEYIDVYNPQTQKYEKQERWFCKAKVYQAFQYINSSYTMAYLSVKNKKDYLNDKSKVKIDEDEVIAFWDIIGGVKVDESGTEEEPVYSIHNRVMTPEEIAEYFFVSDLQKREYLESVYLISQLIGVEVFEDNIHTNGNRLNIPLYYQYKQPWGNKPYGNGNIAKNGCAPTCIAMVLTHLKGYTITPSNVVDFTGNRYYVDGVGSSWDIFPACANHWGVSCISIGTSKGSVVEALSAGKPVILSMGPGTFTRSGHLIVLTGITENGKVTVNDPNDNDKKNHVNKEFSLSQVLGEAKGGWRFE